MKTKMNEILKEVYKVQKQLAKKHDELNYALDQLDLQEKTIVEGEFWEDQWHTLLLILMFEVYGLLNYKNYPCKLQPLHFCSYSNAKNSMRFPKGSYVKKRERPSMGGSSLMT